MNHLDSIKPIPSQDPVELLNRSLKWQALVREYNPDADSSVFEFAHWLAQNRFRFRDIKKPPKLCPNLIRPGNKAQHAKARLEKWHYAVKLFGDSKPRLYRKPGWDAELKAFCEWLNTHKALVKPDPRNWQQRSGKPA